MNRFKIAILIIFWSLTSTLYAKDTKPNILWITIEDWSTDLSCYQTKGIHTPNIDRLASEGIRYTHAFSTSPVCSPSRSAMMTGFHQNYIGANQHRENNKQALPFGIQPIPHLMKAAGYFTALMSWKIDCNFTPNKRDQLFEGKDWAERKPEQPFFARITFGGTHRYWIRDPARPIEMEEVDLPPYYPNTDFCKRDWANGLEQMQLVDREVGAILQRLEEEGLAENTLVFFVSDHGRCHVRGKQFLYDGGIRVPMIMRWPGKVKPNQVSDDMVMSIDICATLLDVAGVDPLVPIHGKSLFSKDLSNRKYIFAARDKMDETHDAMRAIRSKDYKLILNLIPERPYCQYNHYKEGSYPMLAELNLMNMKGELNPAQAAFLAPTKPKIELFDLQKDPYEINNLAKDKRYKAIKTTLLQELENWRKNVIKDKEISIDFRAAQIFPKKPMSPTVDKWVEANKDKYDFKKHGWPAWFPTRSLKEWEKVREDWLPYVFRKPGIALLPPEDSIVHSIRKKPRTHAKFNGFKKHFKEKITYQPRQTNTLTPSPPFKSDWTSLRKHQTPQWLIDAKFGIYCHWGIQTLRYIPAYKNLSADERIKLFKGEKFDAEEWANLYEKAGAKFGGVIGWHGSPFKHWNSDLSDYNSFKMGPKIDIVGEVFKALRAKGIKTLVSYHSIKGNDWIDFAKEGVDKYSPDLFWVDSSFGGTKGGNHKKVIQQSKYIGEEKEPLPVFNEKYQRDFITYFYNKALENGKEVEFIYKSHDIPPGVGMRDLENGILNHTAYDVWMTDMDINIPPDWETPGWFYRQGIPTRSANELVDMLMDVISKNGIFLLNIPPKSDGTFPKEVVENLEKLGHWLAQNGEAVYGTSPWFIFGEGTNSISQGNNIFHHNNHFAKIQYGIDDIRFTTKGNNLYATCLGKPVDELKIGALKSSFKIRQGDIISITHLGSGKSIEWEHREDALVLNIKDIKMDDMANAFKIELNFN